jgi:microcystin-dependent protein
MLGTIFIVPFGWAPTGYLICRGQLVSTTQFSGLFSLIGTLYGGNGQTEFGLPNLYGRVPLGFGAEAGDAYPLASAAGATTATLGIDNLPSHSHDASFTPTTGTESVTIPATTGDLQVGVAVDATSNAAANATPSTANNMLSTLFPATSRIYGPTATTNLVPLGGVSASVTGTASTAARTLDIPTVTGGSVAVSPTGGSAPFSILPPSLALNFIIAMQGVYPERP